VCSSSLTPLLWVHNRREVRQFRGSEDPLLGAGKSLGNAVAADRSELLEITHHDQLGARSGQPDVQHLLGPSRVAGAVDGQDDGLSFEPFEPEDVPVEDVVLGEEVVPAPLLPTVLDRLRVDGVAVVGRQQRDLTAVPVVQQRVDRRIGAFDRVLGRGLHEPHRSDGTGHGIFYTYPSYDGVLRLLAYPVGLLVSAVGSVLVVSSFLRSVADPVRARTVRYLVRGLPLIAVAAVAAGVAAAASTGFSYGDTAIWRPTAAALAITALGVVAARYLSVRADLAGPTGPPLDDVVAEA